MHVYCLEELDRPSDALRVLGEAIQLLKLRKDSDPLDRYRFCCERLQIRGKPTRRDEECRQAIIEDITDCIHALQECEESKAALVVGSSVGRKISNLFMDRGRENWPLGNFTEARSDLNKSVLADPTNFEARATRAESCWFFSRHDIASKDFEEVFREIEIMEGVDADDLPNREEICFCYSVRGRYRFLMRDFEGAASDCEKTLYLLQENRVLLRHLFTFLLAYSRCFLGDFESASEMIDVAYQLSPGCVITAFETEIREFMPVLKPSQGLSQLKRSLGKWAFVDSPCERVDFLLELVLCRRYPGWVRVSSVFTAFLIPSFVWIV